MAKEVPAHWLTTQQVMQRLGQKKDWVGDRRNEGKLVFTRGYRTGTQRRGRAGYLYELASVEALAQEMGQGRQAKSRREEVVVEATEVDPLEAGFAAIQEGIASLRRAIKERDGTIRNETLTELGIALQDQAHKLAARMRK